MVIFVVMGGIFIDKLIVMEKVIIIEGRKIV